MKTCIKCGTELKEENTCSCDNPCLCNNKENCECPEGAAHCNACHAKHEEAKK